MVTITNGKATRYVSSGAYNTIYKAKGYYIVGKEVKNIEKEHVKAVAQEEYNEDDEVNEVVESNDNNEELDWVTELLEKPTSQWTKEEIASFVKEKNIDTSSAHKLSEVRDIVKDWINKYNG